jgi:hypothetical protein
MPDALSPIVHERDGAYLSVQQSGTWVTLTLTRRDPTDAIQIALTPDQAGQLAAWLVEHKTRVDLPPTA